MKCPQCAQVVDDRRRHCPECGTTLPRARKYVYGKSGHRKRFVLPLEAKILLGALLLVGVFYGVHLLMKSHG